MNIRSLFIIFLIFLIPFIEGCGFQDSDAEKPVAELRVGVLPEVTEEKILALYNPLFEYLSRETGITIKHVTLNDYAEILDAFHEKKSDLAHFGGYTFVKAYLKDRAVPLVMRDVDTRFTSSFLVKADHPAKSIKEFEGKVLSFGSRLSTSGHLMPRYFFAVDNINPEKFFSEVLYSGKHDTTAFGVRDGKTDLGVANSKIIDSMYQQGSLKKEEVRVLWKTPNYADYVWAMSPDINKTTQIKIREAFLNLSIENPEHKAILDHLEAHHFLPASVDDFSMIQRTVEQIVQD